MKVNFDEIDVLSTNAGGGSEYYHNGQPFTGIIVDYHPNGALECEISVVNSHKCGRVASYFENGQIEEEYFEKYNRMYSTYKRWDENGVLLLEQDNGAEP